MADALRARPRDEDDWSATLTPSATLVVGMAAADRSRLE
jgi:hypothetical protein